MIFADAQNQPTPPRRPVPAPDRPPSTQTEERDPGPSLPERRPAETTAAASAVALLVARLLGVDDADVVTALAIVIGAVPSLVTWWEVRRGRP